MKIKIYSLTIMGIACLKIAAPQDLKAVSLQDGFGKCATALQGNCPGLESLEMEAVTGASAADIQQAFNQYQKDHPTCTSYKTVMQFCMIPIILGNTDIIGCLNKIKALESQAPAGSPIFKQGGACDTTTMFMSQEQQQQYSVQEQQMKAKMDAIFANMKKNMPHKKA